MHISLPDATTAAITLRGEVGHTDLLTLRQALLAAVDRTAPQTELLVDARGVTSFDDCGISAFSAAWSRTEWSLRLITVLADEGSPIEVALRRLGHLRRITVHPDAPAAHEAIKRPRTSSAWDAVPKAVDRGQGPQGIANPFRQVVS
jgi:hypothetical protein